MQRFTLLQYAGSKCDILPMGILACPIPPFLVISANNSVPCVDGGRSYIPTTMFKLDVSLVMVAMALRPALAQSPVWGQCGGTGW